MRDTEPHAVFDLPVVRRAGLSPVGIGLLLAFADASALAFLGLLLSRSNLAGARGGFEEGIETAALAGLMLVPLAKGIFGLYLSGRFELADRGRRCLQAAMLCVGALMVPFTLVTSVRPMIAYGLAAALAGFSLTFALDLVLVQGLMGWNRRWRTPVVILGAGAQGLALAEKLHHLPWLGMRPVAVFDDDESLWNTRVAGVPVNGPTELARAAAEQAEAVIIADAARHGPGLETLIKGLPFKEVYRVIGDGPVSALEARCHNLHGTLALRVDPRPSAAYLKARRALDVLAAAALLVVLAPLMALIALAIRLDTPGPVLFRQRRWAGGTRTFDLLKFRSMRIDAESQLRRLLDGDPTMRAEYETYHKLTCDPRVTPFGRFLRKASLDELPQLWNVLMGDMSLIGPRAYLPSELPEVGEAVQRIGQVRPGITGFWQVSGRHRTRFCERVAMDVFYVANRGPLFDLMILVKTVGVLLSGDGS